MGEGDVWLADGRRVVDQEWVRINLAKVYAKLEFLRLINWKVAWTATQGHLDVADVSSIKVFGTEFYLGSATPAHRGDRADRDLEARLSRRGDQGQARVVFARPEILTFGGGTNEVQRDLIAIFGLGMPKIPSLRREGKRSNGLLAY